MTIPRIEAPYLLALFGVSVHEVDGQRFLDRRWAQELRRHAEYIPDLRLFCYVEKPQLPPAGFMRVDDCPLLGKVRFLCVPKPRNMLHALRMLPDTVRALWSATRGVAVVHSGIAGWPIPTAWLLLPMQVLRGFLSVIVVEPARWPFLHRSTSVPRRLWRSFSDAMSALCVRCAHLPVFSHEACRPSLLEPGADRGMVIPAACVDACDILDEPAAARLARARMKRPGLHLVYAGRLARDQGIQWLVQALTRERHASRIHLDVFGAGPLEAWLLAAEAERRDLRIRFLGTVPCGPQLLATLVEYDALVLPTLTNEQPRMLFDAYSQGLPVIASASDGIRDALADGVQGATFRAGDARELAAALLLFAELRPSWDELARNCLASARRKSYQEMHRVRAEAIREALRQRSAPVRLRGSQT